MKKPSEITRPPKAAPRASRWIETAKEIGIAAVAAGLPILIKAASEALARNEEKRSARRKP